MTELLRKAFEKASELAPDEQDALAQILIRELEDEKTWDTALSETQDELASLADAALREHRPGKTRPLDPEAL